MNYIAYYRISTKSQAESGLGLDAQREAVRKFIRFNGNKLIAEFCETESGKNDDRPELSKAIQCSKDNDGILVIAKLDRLSRNLAFICQLMDAKIRFICCDMPDATELTIHIFASLAQWERKRISERTKEALRMKIRSGWQAGTDNLTDEGRQKSYQRNRINAWESTANRHAYHFILPRLSGGMSLADIARELNHEGYRTRYGKMFYIQSVKQVIRLFKDQNDGN